MQQLRNNLLQVPAVQISPGQLEPIAECESPPLSPAEEGFGHAAYVAGREDGAEGLSVASTVSEDNDEEEMKVWF